jgi:hypothetical protein
MVVFIDDHRETYGVEPISGSYPAAVGVPRSAVVAQTTGSLATPSPPYLSFGTQAGFANEPGSFSASGGVGTLMATVYGSAPTPLGYARVTPGENPFGGALRLLGTLRRQTTRTTGMGMGSLMASQLLPLGNVGATCPPSLYRSLC